MFITQKNKNAIVKVFIKILVFSMPTEIIVFIVNYARS